MQFSKIIVIASYILMIASLVVALFIPGFSETLLITIIGGCSTILATTLIFYLKKSQAENTMKIYLSAYKQIVDIKKENNEDIDIFLENAENNILNKLNNNLDNVMDDATTIIEKQNIM